MGRLLGIDYGKKRVGIAVTDPLKMIASPLDTIATNELLVFLKNYQKSEQIEEFIVGMPKNTNNESTHATPLVVEFIEQLRKNFPDIPIHEVDERFTSKMALHSMIEGGSKKKDRQNKGNIDKISAAIILQSYMESQQF